MKQFVLLDPEGQVRAMSTSVETLDDLIDGMGEDDSEGWEVQRCGVRFWNDHPELMEGD